MIKSDADSGMTPKKTRKCLFKTYETETPKQMQKVHFIRSIIITALFLPFLAQGNSQVQGSNKTAPILIKEFKNKEGENEDIQKLVSDSNGLTYIITKSGFSRLDDEMDFISFKDIGIKSIPLFSGVGVNNHFYLTEIIDGNAGDNMINIWRYDPKEKLFPASHIYRFHNGNLFDSELIVPENKDLVILAIRDRNLNQSYVHMIDPYGHGATTTDENPEVRVRNVSFSNDGKYLLLQGTNNKSEYKQKAFKFNSRDNNHYYINEIISDNQKFISVRDNYVCGFEAFPSSPGGNLFGCNDALNDKPAVNWKTPIASSNSRYTLLPKNNSGSDPVVYAGTTKKLYAFNRNTGEKLSGIEMPAVKPYYFTGGFVENTATGEAYRMFSTGNNESETQTIGVVVFTPETTSFRPLFIMNDMPASSEAFVIHDEKLYFAVKNKLYSWPLADALMPLHNIDGNLIPESERGLPHRISWEVHKDNNRVDAASGHLDIDGSDPMLLDPFRWPMLVSEAINRQGGILKAGVKQQKGDSIVPGKPEASQYQNWLWLAENKVSEGYHVSLSVDLLQDVPESVWSLNFGTQQAFTSEEGDDFSKKTIHFTVDREGEKTQEYTFTTREKDRFMAVADIARQVNKAIPDVQLGEKASGDIVTPLASQYRNKIWVKTGANGKSSASVQWRVE